MQAVIRWTLGTSWPHSRMASPVHICCASEKARLGRAESAVAAKAMAKRSAILLVRWKVIDAFPKVARARCWPLFIGGAARGLRCRTRHPSPGSHPVWLLEFCRCSNQKCCAAQLRIMRQCCEAAMARVNTSLTVACAPRRAKREMRDNAVLTLAHLQGSAGFEEGTDAGRCVCVLRPRSNGSPPPSCPSNGSCADCSHGASGSGRCPARRPQPAGLAFRPAKTQYKCG